MDLKNDINNTKNNKNTENYSYLENTITEVSPSNKNFMLQQKISLLEYQLRKITSENQELKQLNKIISSKIDFLLKNNTIVKNVKNEMNDCSQISHLNNQDNLKEFFFLLVICEKMNYLDQDRVWNVDSNYLYMTALKNDLDFYEWPDFIKQKIAEQFGNSNDKTEIKLKNIGCLEKLK